MRATLLLYPPRLADGLAYWAGLLKLGEVLDRTNHLAGVAVLVVVPANNLYLIGVLVDLGYHGLGSVEERTELHTDYIARNDLVLGVTEALGLSSLHGSVDTLFGDVFTLNNCNQDSGRAGRSRNALCRTDQFAVQFRNNQADSLGSTGAAKAIGLVIPELNGKLIGSAQRVPTPTGSTTILVAVVKGKDITKEGINAAMKAAQTESFGYTEDEIVSSDVIGMKFGSLFDATQTMVAKIDEDTYQVQVVSWYDNENSYTSQMVRTIKYLAELK